MECSFHFVNYKTFFVQGVPKNVKRCYHSWDLTVQLGPHRGRAQVELTAVVNLEYSIHLQPYRIINFLLRWAILVREYSCQCQVTRCMYFPGGRRRCNPLSSSSHTTSNMGADLGVDSPSPAEGTVGVRRKSYSKTLKLKTLCLTSFLLRSHRNTLLS